MCSITDQPSATTASRFAAMVEDFGELGARISGMLADPSTASELAGVPSDAVAGFVTSLAGSVSAGTAALTVVTGQLHHGVFELFPHGCSSSASNCSNSSGFGDLRCHANTLLISVGHP